MAEAKELEGKLEAAAEERRKVEEERKRTEEGLRGELASLQTQQEESLTQLAQLTTEKEGLGANLARLTAEREELVAKLTELQDAREVTLSEVASLQSDLATVGSERNTQLMATEKVRGYVCERSFQWCFIFMSYRRSTILQFSWVGGEVKIKTQYKTVVP